MVVTWLDVRIIYLSSSDSIMNASFSDTICQVIAELDSCQIIILSILVPSTNAYTHVLCLALDFPNETRYHFDD